MPVNKTVGAIGISVAGAVAGLVLGAALAGATQWARTPVELVFGSLAAGLAVGLTTRRPFTPSVETVLIPAAPAVLLTALVATPSELRTLLPALVCLAVAGVLTCLTTAVTYSLRQRRGRSGAAAYTTTSPVSTRQRSAAYYDR